MSFQIIVEDIMSTHHSLLRRELPKITDLLDVLCRQHPDNKALLEAQQIYQKVRSKVETHLKDEETVLFPMGIALETGNQPINTDMNVLERLAEMEKEHTGCGNTLTSIQQTITGTVPKSSLRDDVIAKIQLVQDDFVVHVDKENSKVHPMFIALVESARAAV